MDIVIDHHPNEGVDAGFVDHREGVGVTATVLTEHVRELGTGMDTASRTALPFAIRRETLWFLRGVTREGYDAAGWLHEHADPDLLRTLATPSVAGATVDATAGAIANRTVQRSVLMSGVGRTSERDALPQAANYHPERSGSVGEQTTRPIATGGDSMRPSTVSPPPGSRGCVGGVAPGRL